MKAGRILLGLLLALLMVGVGWIWLNRTPEAPTFAHKGVPPSTNITSATASPIEVPQQFQPTPAPDRPREEIVGIGAILQKDKATGALMIMGAVPGSPAAAAGLSGKFIVRSIDGQSVEGLGLQDCVNLLRGPIDKTGRAHV